ncbi:acyl-CoA dehydrogenase family protein [Rhodococcus jostii]|uniref:acyl-CoA dehydrogenase family protein n=1 Tax=Rhodococcus jostii TaxID=132919 RepID=UPI00364D6A8C
MPGTYVSAWKDETVRALAATASKFVDEHLVARREEWETDHQVGRDVWREAGALGLLCCSIPEEYGGGGGTLAHDLVVCETQWAAGDTAWGNIVHSGVVAHYLLSYGTEKQKCEWLPAMASGEVVAAVAMTEPGAGSDLKNIRTRAVASGDELIIDGSKTFISNGQSADLILVVAKTNPDAGAKGISLVLVDARDAPGFVRGRVLDKIGQSGADTSELAFNGVKVPASNVLGETTGRGFAQLMAQLVQERLLIAATATASMEAALTETLAYVKTRSAFGQSIFDFQATRFALAEMATTVHLGRVFLDSCVERHLAGELDTATASMAKWWLTEQQVDVIDRCLQLHGGYGYVREYSIARRFADSRAQRIYGGTNEIMKEMVARSL